MSGHYSPSSTPDQEGTFAFVTNLEVSIGEDECILDQNAPVRGLIEQIGDKWSLLVLYVLEGGPVRFNALERRLPGVSQKMLSQTLRKLEHSGLVTRTVYAEVPPRVEYELSPLGLSLRPLMAAMCDWSRTHGKKLT